MRALCPYCGERDLREFVCRGHAVALDRPDPTADLDLWNDYLHLRDNPAGPTRELWYHLPCSTWLVVHRNTVTHEIIETRPAMEAAP